MLPTESRDPLNSPLCQNVMFAIDSSISQSMPSTLDPQRSSPCIFHQMLSSINLNDLILISVDLLVKFLQGLHDLSKERRRCFAWNCVANLPHDTRFAAVELMLRRETLQLSKFLVVERPR